MHRFLAFVFVIAPLIATGPLNAADSHVATAATETQTKEVDAMTQEGTRIPKSGRNTFDRDTFEQFVEMRIGTGDPVYWYGQGVISNFPDGKIIARVEGVDLGRLHRPDPDVPLAHFYTRKFVVFRDPETDEILRDEAGKIILRGFPYQYFKVWLDGDVLRTDIESGAGETMFKLSAGEENEVRHIGDLTVFTMPVPINSPTMQAWEKYDFLVLPEGSAEPRNQVTWSKYSPNFPWMGPGFNTQHAWLYRYDAYEDLPQSVRTIIETVPGADLWRNPPKDLDEIRALQNPDDN